MKKIFLSYSLDSTTPSYGGREPLQSKQTKNMACGDSCNQIQFTMSNHLGTHIDCPSHFDPKGRTVDSYEADFWTFHRVCKLDIDAQPGELIDLEKYLPQIPIEAEALIIRTGFCRKRQEEVYWQNNPGLTAQSGLILRQQRKLRLIGFDLISLSAYQHREEGRRAHHAFLHGDLGSSPILILEDMDLRELDATPVSLSIFPLRLRGGDGAPVTVVATI